MQPAHEPAADPHPTGTQVPMSAGPLALGKTSLVGAPLWGAAMALSALVFLWLNELGGTFHTLGILSLFFAGGTLAWPFAITLAMLATRKRRAETRFAAYLLLLAVATVAMTAFLFAMDYRLFYSRWHEPFGTRIWMFQFVFTSASAVYQFLVAGLRFYFPLGAVMLLVTSLWLARRPPRLRH